jgi:voltage-gated potassium channel
MMRPPSESSPVFALVIYRLRWAALAVVILVLVATTGYVVLEDYGWIDGLYMTVITLGTIGYQEVHPLGTAGRIFTIGVVVAGFMTFVYAVSALTNLFVSGDALAQLQNRKAKRMRDQLNDHVIVVGYGRVGQAVVRGLQGLEKHCIVIECDPARQDDIHETGVVGIIGDATNQAELDKAGIGRASALVAACDSDAENLVVVLTARSMSAHLRIVSRVNEAAWIDRIIQAGADVAQSPYSFYGMSLAASAASSIVLDLHSLPLLGLATEEIQVPLASPLIGRNLAQILQSHPFLQVVGLRREGMLRPWHAIEDVVQAEDILLVLGPPEHLMAFAHDADPATASSSGAAAASNHVRTKE